MLKLKVDGDDYVKQVKGIHHVTAITSSAEKIYDFFTDILGMRLVKKTVNQDDINTYHLFFADDRGNAGTDMTFFDFQGIQKAVKGTDEIAKTSFRVPNNKAIHYWEKRLKHYQVEYQKPTEVFGVLSLEFTDFDGQEYVLVSDEGQTGVKSGVPWLKGPVPNEFAVTGLGPIHFRVTGYKEMDYVMTKIMQFELVDHEGDLFLYETGEGGNGARVIVEHTKGLQRARQGYGGVHHVAFRVDDKADLELWTSYLRQIKAPNSGFVERFYFQSLYTRLYPGILFEFATDGPGFIDDEEPYETLGEKLALPPKFRDKREQIEKIVRPIDTARSNKVYQKEYFDD